MTRARSLFLSAALAGGVLAMLEVISLSLYQPDALPPAGGAFYLLAVLLPRAVLVGLSLAIVQGVLFATATAVISRVSASDGARAHWLALTLAGAVAIGAGALALSVGQGRQARTITSNPFLMPLILLALAWLTYRMALLARRILLWVQNPIIGARRRAWRRWVAAAPLVALSVALLTMDRVILVRLYAPLHVSLQVAAVLALQGALALGLRPPHLGRRRSSPGSRRVAFSAIGLALATLAAFETIERGTPRHSAALNALRLNGAFSKTVLGLTDARRAASSASAHKVAPGDPAPSPPPVAPTLAPSANVLLITVDALRADHLGAYGYQRPTSPSIDRLAAAGTTFERAYTSAPHTSFALTSLLTGSPAMALSNLGVLDQRPTLAEIAGASGYHTAAFFTPAVFFVDGERFGRFDELSFGFQTARRQVLPEDASASLLTDQVLAHLTEAAPERFVVWAHYFGPHEPYVHHPHADGSFGPTALDRYDGEIRATDREIGRLVEAVRTRAPNTIVVVTADHGEEFGDHGGAYHGTTLFEEQVRVPLVISIPAVAPHRIRAPVSTTSLLPTLLGLTGLPSSPTFDGTDLRPWLAFTAPLTESGLPPVFVENVGQRAVVWGREKLLCDSITDTCALFDLSRDPAERIDVAVARPERVAALRAQLAGWIARLEQQRGAQDPWDAMDSRTTPVQVRRSIARRMARLPEARWRARVRAEWKTELDPVAKAWLAAAASQSGDEQARAALRGLVADSTESDPELAALAALARSVDAPVDAADDAGAALERVTDVNLRCALMRTLARDRAPRAASILEREYETVRSRICAAEAMVRLRDPSTIPFILSRVAAEPYTTVQGALVRALRELRDARALPILREMRARTTEADLLRIVENTLADLEGSDLGT